MVDSLLKGWLIILVALTGASAQAAAPSAAGDAAAAPRILVFGDSLSAGYGIDGTRSWVALLTRRLQAEGYGYRVVNASVSGETTAGGLTRLPRALEVHKPAIAIIELGANDGLRGLPLAQMQKNLEAMITLATGAGSRVLLLGMQMPPNYGPTYTTGFYNTFSELSKRHQISLVPFFMDGVALRSELMQDDELHPNEAGQPRLLDNVWPFLKPLLQRNVNARGGAPAPAHTAPLR